MIVIISTKTKANNSMAGYSILKLDGISEYYSEPYSKKLLTGDAITIESWFRSENNNGTIIERSSKGSYTYKLSLKDNVLTFSVNTGKDYTVRATMNDVSVWTHVAAIYNSGTGRIKLYINGVLTSQEIYKPAEILDFGSDSLFIGRSGDLFPGNTFFKGEISDARIWNRTERTPLQIKSYMPREKEYELNPAEVVTFEFDKTTSSNEQTVSDPLAEDEQLSQYFQKEEPWLSVINDQSKINLTSNK